MIPKAICHTTGERAHHAATEVKAFGGNIEVSDKQWSDLGALVGTNAPEIYAEGVVALAAVVNTNKLYDLATEGLTHDEELAREEVRRYMGKDYVRVDSFAGIVSDQGLIS